MRLRQQHNSDACNSGRFFVSAGVTAATMISLARTILWTVVRSSDMIITTT